MGGSGGLPLSSGGLHQRLKLCQQACKGRQRRLHGRLACAIHCHKVQKAACARRTFQEASGQDCGQLVLLGQLQRLQAWPSDDSHAARSPTQEAANRECRGHVGAKLAPEGQMCHTELLLLHTMQPTCAVGGRPANRKHTTDDVLLPHTTQRRHIALGVPH